MGSEFEKYRYRPYSPSYARFFAIERKRIRSTLPNAVIEHVGSTAVKGLGGKGIIDILVGVDGSLRAPNSLMATSGYTSGNKNRQDRCFFHRDVSYRGRIRRVHVHLVRLYGKVWQRTISFRDRLRESPSLRKEYTRMKRKAMRRANGEGELYKKDKNAWFAALKV